MMRTDKHKLKPLNSLQETLFLEVMRAYQQEKNYFSDCLSSYSFNHNINLKNNDSYREIRDQLVKDKYCSKYHLPARLWKMALKEAYDLHVRTYEAQLSFLKDELLKKIYGYFYHQNNHDNKQKEINQFKDFFVFAIHSAFYNYFTFKKVEQQIFCKNFYQARIYERIAQYLISSLSKAIEKKILTQTQTKILAQLFLKENKNVFFHTFCHLLIGTIQDFRSYKPIVLQINPTMQLDGECYKLYSDYDEITHKNRWFLDVMSLQKGQRIKRMELTGFHHSKKIIKQSANLTLSFDPLTMNVSAHFSFEHKNNKENAKNFKSSKNSKVSKDSELLIGGDFGLTESITFSDGFVLGRKQGQILKRIAERTKQSVTHIQKFSLPEFFGLERKNQGNRRNHPNHCFNHNLRLKNINTNYRKRQQRYNKRLDNFKYSMTNEMIKHFMSNSIYGNYQDFLSKNKSQNQNYTDNYIHLVFESLDYSNLGRNKAQKRQINLIKGIYSCLENKIKTSDLPFKISYVNPSYTSQMCSNCYYVAKENRQQGTFRCLHCGYTVLEDEKFQCLKEVLPKEALPPEDDFHASQNIRDRLSRLPHSLKQQKKEIKDYLMKKHETIKGSCKIAKVQPLTIECCYP